MTDIDDARALAAAFREQGYGNSAYTIEAALDEALGLAGQGIFLTHEEAATALRAVEEFRDGAEISRKESNLMHALAARLKGELA